MQFTSKKDKAVFFKEDIVKEMSQELNIPEKEIQEIIDLNIKYIKKSVEENPILLISLPNLAKLRFNLKLGMSSKYDKKGLTSSSGIKSYEAISEKVDLLTSYKNPRLANFKKPLSERLFKKITKFKKAFQVYDRMYHMWAAIEKKSNEILDKIK